MIRRDMLKELEDKIKSQKNYMRSEYFKTQNSEYYENNIAYLEYILKHKLNIRDIWDDYCKHNAHSCYVWSDYDWHAINTQILAHDDSKISNLEFGAYRRWFYTCSNEIRDEIDFKLAWNHHQKNNSHHWEYWVLINTNEPLPMQIFSLIEMLCDWSAMSLHYGDLPSNYYEENKSKMILHKDTTNSIISELPLFDECVKRVRQNQKALR